MKLKLNDFRGETPAIPNQKLPAGGAAQAENCLFRSGSIVPYRGLVASEAVSSDVKSVRYWRTDSNEVCLKQPFLADYVPGVVDSRDMLFVTGGAAAPEIVFATGEKRAWGVDKPTAHAVVDRLVDMSASPSPLAGTWGTTTYTVDYVYTCVDEYGRESAPSPPTEGVISELKVHQSKYCMLDYASKPGEQTFAEEFLGFKLTFEGSPACAKKRIYRIEVGDESAEFLFVGEATGSEFTDFERVNFTDTDGTTNQRGQLKTCQADALVTDGFEPPPSNLIGIRLLSSGSIAGFRPNSKDLYFSDPLYQYVFPSKYSIKMPQQIRQIEAFGDDLIVFMDNHVSIVRGEPGMMSVGFIPGIIGSQCASGRGAVVFEGGVIFPGHDGLYLYNGALCQNLTKNIMTPVQWQSWIGSAEPPFSFHAVFYDNKYYAFRTGDSSGKITVFDLSDGTIHAVFTGFEIKSLYTPKHGPLGSVSPQYKGNVWVIGNGYINKLDYAETNMTAKWVSGIKRFLAPYSMAAGIIIAEYSDEQEKAHIKIEAGRDNGAKVVLFDKDVPYNKPFRIDNKFAIDNASIEITSSNTIHEVVIATSIQELAA